MSFVPRTLFFVKGKGYHKSKLGSFEQALRSAGIAKFNIVKVSSIFPPYCIEIPKEDGLAQLRAGQILFAVMSRASSNEYNRLVSASIGIAKPSDQKTYGYVSEHHAFGVKPEDAGEFAEDLAAEMLATTLGVSFDPEANYDEKKESFKMDGKIVETNNTTESGIVRAEGEWLTILAAAIFIL